MRRAVIVGSGSAIPSNRVTNDMMARVMDTSDEWIRQRTGIETRYYVEPGTATSDLALEASRAALEMAGVAADELDMITFATMTPDHYFPGCGGILQRKLGIGHLPCIDIRQQCVGFLYGLQLVDAYVRAGMADTVLLVGAEVHTGFMPFTHDNLEYAYGRSSKPPTDEEYAWNTHFRHLVVLFGDAGAAVVVKAVEDGATDSSAAVESGAAASGAVTDSGAAVGSSAGSAARGRGVIDSVLYTDGTDFDKLYVPGNGFKHRPYIDREQLERGDHIPVMDGRHVFKTATSQMIAVAREVMDRHGVTVDDLSMVLMHQANKRINEYVQHGLGVPPEKTLHNIERYGNTTAATIPLLWDECARGGKIQPGDLVLLVAFGAGINWGATLVRA